MRGGVRWALEVAVGRVMGKQVEHWGHYEVSPFSAQHKRLRRTKWEYIEWLRERNARLPLL
jgi:hypothetical protein